MKKILVRGNIIVTGCLQSLFHPIEACYGAGNGDAIYNESEFDLVITGDLKVESIRVMSDDTKVYATGSIIVYGV